MVNENLTEPGEVSGRPKLVLKYRTDPNRIADLLPPGLEPVGDPIVQIGIYCVPVHGEPEYGVSTKVPASFEGVDGQYCLGIGIDQESAIFISRETNGQPKFPCNTRFFRLGNRISASCIHQGHTFLSYDGELSDETGQVDPELGVEFEDNEWWIKYSRAVGGAKSYDFEPRIVRVRTVGAKVRSEPLAGDLVLRESAWDPYTDLLPMLEPATAELVTNKFSAREITLEGELDPNGFWPFADTIGGSRWPGERGAPKGMAI